MTLKYPNKSHPGPASGRWKGGVKQQPEYSNWCSMVYRCTNPKIRAWKHYGGRGITVCQRWRDDFWAFVEDVGPKPEGVDERGRSLWTLERIDVNGNYEPGNVKWATWEEQRNNRRKNLAANCPQGHDYSVTGFLNPRGYRECRECVRKKVREAQRRRRARLKAED